MKINRGKPENLVNLQHILSDRTGTMFTLSDIFLDQPTACFRVLINRYPSSKSLR